MMRMMFTTANKKDETKQNNIIAAPMLINNINNTAQNNFMGLNDLQKTKGCNSCGRK